MNHWLVSKWDGFKCGCPGLARQSWTSQFWPGLLRHLRLCYSHSDANAVQGHDGQTGSNRDAGMQAQISGDSRVYEARTGEELIAKIRDAHPYPEISVDAFMRSYAKRLELWDGSKISTITTDDFLADLQRNGFLRIWGVTSAN